MTTRDELRHRIEERIERKDGHWLWTGSLATRGYGRIRIDNQRPLAHRLAYELYVGPIPDGLTIDHLCRVRACVNPDHLEAVPMRVNILRGVGATAIHARQTHCKRGHPLVGEHVYLSSNGHRRCRTCQLERHAARYRSDPEYRMHKIMVTRAWNAARRHLEGSEAAQTLVEYGLLLALIAVIVLVAVMFLGDIVSRIFNDLGNAIR